MYKIKEISKQEYNEFNNTIKIYNLFETVGITESRKFNYEDIKFLGLYDENNVICGTTQFLIEKIPYINKKMASAIKGPNLEFTENNLKNFNIAIKKYLKKNSFLLFRFDLPIAYKIYDKEFNEKETNDTTFFIDSQIKTKLQNAGFKEFFISKNYMGRSPQWTMLVDTKSIENIEKQMNRSVKRGIKTAKEYGLEFEIVNDIDNKIHYFYELHKNNAALNDIDIMPEEYYKNLFSNSQDLKLFLIKINIKTFLKMAEKNFDLKKNKKNEKIYNLAKNLSLKKTNEKYEYIVGHISGFYNSLGYDLFTGLNYDYRDLGAKEFLMDNIFQYCVNSNIDYYDFWGILGEIDEKNAMYPVYKFKKKFSDIIIEYPGFWDVYTNRIVYKIFNKYLKYRYYKNH